MCYCETCHKLRGCSSVSAAGQPPNSFSLPISWVLFPLRCCRGVDEEARSNGLVSGGGGVGVGGGVGGSSEQGEKEGRDSWHIAFHGTKIGHLRLVM